MGEIKAYRIGQKAHCQMYGCRKDAKIAVGNPRFDINSIHLCEEHAMEVYEAYSKLYGVNESADVAAENMKYRRLLTESLKEVQNGSFKKDKAIEIAKEVGVEADDDMKKDTIMNNLIKFLEEGEM
jgi:hypothetical protein